MDETTPAVTDPSRPWWQRGRSGRLILLGVGSGLTLGAFIVPPIVGLFHPDAVQIGAPGWWGMLIPSVLLIIWALVLVARFGWRDYPRQPPAEDSAGTDES